MLASSHAAAVAELPPPPPLTAGYSLFLDFDGTLVDLADCPDDVVVGTDLIGLLTQLDRATGGRVAIVSGRSIAQLDALLGPVAAAFAIVGSHGAERRTASEGTVRPPAHAAIDAAGRAFADFAATRPGVVVERKSLGVALHYRQVPHFEDEIHAIAGRIASEHDLFLQRGKMMAEVRMAGDKGAGVDALMALPRFAGSTPFFFGDDVTDEDGFAAARDHGGGGVLIGPARATRARWRLDDVASLRGWLARGAEALA